MQMRDFSILHKVQVYINSWTNFKNDQICGLPTQDSHVQSWTKYLETKSSKIEENFDIY